METGTEATALVLRKLRKDIKAASATLTGPEARYLVDTYYGLQKYRVSNSNQVAALTKAEEPHGTLAFFAGQMETLENQVRSVLDVYSLSQPLGQWARSVRGIGPVLASGLLAHVDVEKANTAGKLWRFAGLDPTVTWDKGGKRPWNARLKVIAWKIGESFVKVSGHDEAFYGKVYAKRKMLEEERNAAHSFSAQAEISLASKRWKKDTDAFAAYSHGELPQARIHLRACRYAVKLFLAHYLEVGRKLRGLSVPLPYAIEHMGHVDVIPPNGTESRERTDEVE